MTPVAYEHSIPVFSNLRGNKAAASPEDALIHKDDIGSFLERQQVGLQSLIEVLCHCS